MLFFYPNNLEIISRRISFNHSSGILKKTVIEKISFRNTSNENIKEIALETEYFRSNLKITDKNNNEIIYLTNEKLKTKNEVPDNIKLGLQEKDKNKKKYILWLILNEPILCHSYETIFLNYVEYAKKTGKSDKVEKNEMAYINHIMYKEALYYDVIDFYSKETLSIFTHWEEPLELNSYTFYFATVKNNNSISLHKFDNENTHVNIKNNCISFSISNSKRLENNASSIRIIYLFTPEKQQLRLIQVLTWFTLLSPFTGFISVYLNNISYLFDSLEVETVLILTLAFAETRTRLISHKNYIVIALLSTGIIFIVCLIMLFGLFDFFL